METPKTMSPQIHCSYNTVLQNESMVAQIPYSTSQIRSRYHTCCNNFVKLVVTILARTATCDWKCRLVGKSQKSSALA